MYAYAYCYFRCSLWLGGTLARHSFSDSGDKANCFSGIVTAPWATAYSPGWVPSTLVFASDNMIGNQIVLLRLQAAEEMAAVQM